MKINELPVSWYGLSQSETLAILPLVWGQPKSAKTRVDVLKILIQKKDFRKLTEDDVYDLTENDLAFLWNEDFVDGQPIASFSAQNKKFLLPTQGMASVTFQEFLNCNTCFLEFNDTIKNDPTNEAVLSESAMALVFNCCRPQNPVKSSSIYWNGDLREDYNEFVAEHRAKTLKIDFLTATLIVRYWGQELRNFYDRYDILEDKTPNPDTTDPEDEPTWIELALAWKDTHFDLAQDRSLGDFNTISKMLMPDIGMYLVKLKQQNKAREQAQRMANTDNVSSNNS